MSQATLEQQLVVFALGGEEYALPIEHVQEIIRFTEPRAVASPDPAIRGVISLRGKIIAVLDLALRLGLAAEPACEQKIVVLALDGTIAGIVVDQVEEVVTIAAEQLDEVPAGGSDAIDAIVRIDDRLVVLLRPGRLFAGLGDPV